MGILEILGLQGWTAAAPSTGETESVREIVARLGELPADRAHYVAAFAYVLGRVANADLHVSAVERERMERLVRELGDLDATQASLAVEIAAARVETFGATEDFLVTRELAETATRDQRRHVLDCLFAVSAADDSISGAEEAGIRQIASELGFSHREFVEARLAWSDQREVLRGLGPSGGDRQPDPVDR